MIMPKRPLVLLSVLVFAEIYLVLKNPDAFAYILAFDLILSAAMLAVSVKAKSLPVALVICLLLLFPLFTTSRIYTKSELSAEQFTKSCQETEVSEFEARVDTFNSYGTYAQVFVTLTKAGETNIDLPFKARLGTYSGTQLSKGELIVFEGTPTFVSEVENNGFNTRDYLRSKKVFIDFPSVSVISSSSGESAGFLETLRAYTKNVIYKYIPSGDETDTAAFCYAIFAGDKQLLPQEMSDNFSKCGLTHILCVSGMHLSILAGICYCFLSVFPIHKKARCVLIILLCVFYTAFTGFTLSTIRACIMCSVSYIGMIFGKKTDIYRTLFLSLLIICICSPYAVLDISLVMSFLATLGIVCFAELYERQENPSAAKRAVYAAAGIIVANIGAVIFTLPVNAYSFGGISIISAVSTLAVSFIFEILLTCVLILVIICPVCSIALLSPAAVGLGALCRILSKAIIGTARFFSSLKYASISSYFSDVYILLFSVILVFIAMSVAFDKKRMLKASVTATVILGVCFSLLSLVFSISDDRLYKVTYYRKSESNRQMSVKLGTEGYFILNADNSLCTDKGHFLFDEKNGENYLLIIPDESIIPAVLANEIQLFRERYGLEGIFVTNTKEGAALSNKLSQYGIDSYVLGTSLNVGSIDLRYICNDGFIFYIDDGKISTAVLFSDEYSKAPLDGYDISAYFTRKTNHLSIL